MKLETLQISDAFQIYFLVQCGTKINIKVGQQDRCFTDVENDTKHGVIDVLKKVVVKDQKCTILS